MNCKVIMVAHNLVFNELANAIVLSLEEMGHRASTTRDINTKSDLNIIIKAGRPYNTSINKTNILFQTEQLWNRRDRGVYDLSNGYQRVLEMFRANTRIPNGTKNVVYCPVGYSFAFENKLPIVDEDMDVYFYGSLSPRRRVVIGELQKNGINIVGYENMYGIERNMNIMRSKIIMNIKASDTWAYAPIHCLIAQCNKKFVMIEKCNGGYGPYIPDKHFVEYKSIEDAKEKVDYWLSHDKERNEFAVNAYEDIKKNIVFTNYIKEAIKGLL